jgi:hypothetical protein
MTFTVRDRLIHRDGAPVRLVGANYFPSAAGCRMWTEWDPVAIRRDFTAMAAAGLNAVRLFVLWRDFEPRAGELDGTAMRRLAEAVAVAREAGLLCLVSLYTIWMNGERLDPPWRVGRNLWRDPGLLDRAEALARRIARDLRDAGNVVAFDLGDEIANVAPAEAAALTRDEVAAWYARVAGAIRAESPGRLVLQANDASGVFGTGPFAVDNARGLDLIGIHGFPTWAPGGIESTLSYKATNLASFLVRYASAYGVPLLDELGSYGVDEATATAYLSAATAAAFASGAAGVFVWCWTDIVSEHEPYAERPTERAAGLCTADGTAKPRLRAYRRIAAGLDDLVVDREPPRVAVYLNDRVRAAGSSYLDGGSGPLAVFVAHLLLKRAHLDHAMVAGDALSAAVDLVVCPSVEHLTLRDLRRIRAAAEGGATVYLSAGSHLHGFPGEELTGARIVDFRLGDAGKNRIGWDDRSWPLDWRAATGTPSTMDVTTGKVLATFADGSPALVANAVGKGQVLFSNVPFERLHDGPGRLDTGAERFYRRLARLAGVTPAADCAEPAVELIVGTASGRRRLVAVNHAAAPVRTDVTVGGRTVPVALGAKDWTVVDLTEPA